MITWLKGMTRVKDEQGSIEIQGYRCSSCNHFEEKQKRICPKCKGEYLGTIIGESNND